MQYPAAVQYAVAAHINKHKAPFRQAGLYTQPAIRTVTLLPYHESHVFGYHPCNTLTQVQLSSTILH